MIGIKKNTGEISFSIIRHGSWWPGGEKEGGDMWDILHGNKKRAEGLHQRCKVYEIPAHHQIPLRRFQHNHTHWYVKKKLSPFTHLDNTRLTEEKEPIRN